MLFSTGQLYFALLFVAAFAVIMIAMYRKDLKQLKNQYKGTYWILFSFLLFICILFAIKFYMKE